MAYAALMRKTASVASSHNGKQTVEREDRYSLEYVGRHRAVRLVTLIGDRSYKEDRISVTRATANPVTESMFLLQTLASVVNVGKGLDDLLRIRGRVMREEGTLYDEEFPATLRQWITEHPVIPGAYTEHLATASGERLTKELAQRLIVQLIAILEVLD